MVTRTRRNAAFISTNIAGLFFCAKARQNGDVRGSNGKWECLLIRPRFIQNSIFRETREQRPNFYIVTLKVRALVTTCYQWMLPSAQKFVALHCWDSFSHFCSIWHLWQPRCFFWGRRHESHLVRCHHTAQQTEKLFSSSDVHRSALTWHQMTSFFFGGPSEEAPWCFTECTPTQKPRRLSASGSARKAQNSVPQATFTDNPFVTNERTFTTTMWKIRSLFYFLTINVLSVWITCNYFRSTFFSYKI